MFDPKIQNIKTVAVVGLGYVGSPLALEIGNFFKVVGFDTDRKRVDELSSGFDRSGELSSEILLDRSNITFTANELDLVHCDIFIVCVPTPVLASKSPDLRPLEEASRLVGRILSTGTIVVFESTVAPGMTRKFCIPVLEEVSGLIEGEHFGVGYSPERINPGDKTRTLTSIIKVTSGSSKAVAEVVDQFYGQFITAGTFKAATIEVAEAAKVIENTQRDLNIALMNELNLIFNLIGLNINDVLEASRTKWNFIDFKPGLVGGHCIGVDPYYLTHAAQEAGYHPEIILAGRRLNDRMPREIAAMAIKHLISNIGSFSGAKILILGFTFKENCSDTRNTKVKDLARELEEFGCQVSIFDPMISVDNPDLEGWYVEENNFLRSGYSMVILAVSHDYFKKYDATSYSDLLVVNGILFDLKNCAPSFERKITL